MGAVIVVEEAVAAIVTDGDGGASVVDVDPRIRMLVSTFETKQPFRLYKDSNRFLFFFVTEGDCSSFRHCTIELASIRNRQRLRETYVYSTA